MSPDLRLGSRLLIVLASLEVAGGLFLGMTGLKDIWISTTGVAVRVTVPPMAFGILTIVAGLGLMCRLRIGFAASLISQLAQVPVISTPYRYIAFAGIKTFLLLSDHGPALVLGVGGDVSMSAHPPDGAVSSIGSLASIYLGVGPARLASGNWVVGLNLAALFAVAVLLHHRATGGRHQGAPPQWA